jgi:hypothetical protein
MRVATRERRLILIILTPEVWAENADPTWDSGNISVFE